MKLAAYFSLIKAAAIEFNNDKVGRLGAAVAFYTVLSLSPLVLIVISIAGLVFGQEAARGEMFSQIRDMVGDQGGKAIEEMLAANRSERRGIFAIVSGVVMLVVAASGVFAQLQDALNVVWNVDGKKTGGGIWRMILDRLLSFSTVCVMAFLLLVLLAFNAFVNAAAGMTGASSFGPAWLYTLVNTLFSLGLATVMFAMIFKVLPATAPPWADVWIGAVVTALLFNVGKFAIGLYIGTTGVGSAYGAAGSFVVVLVWIYYSTQLLLFGAEITKVYSARHGSGVGGNRGGLAAASAENSQSSIQELHQ